MKKNLLAVAAMAVVAFFVSTEIAKAADITFSGQLRSRWESSEHSSGGNGGNGQTTTLVGNEGRNSFTGDPQEEIFTSSSTCGKSKHQRDHRRFHPTPERSYLGSTK